jgi:hypothetical protein
MRQVICVVIFTTICLSLAAQTGRIGINTASPLAMLHVKDSNVLFSGTAAGLPFPRSEPPVNGPGVRMMWYPGKAAFRLGEAVNNGWHKDSIGDYSVAMGFGTRASGLGSFAAGYLNYADATYSFAFGRESEAIAPYGIAMGFRAVAFTRGGVAMGHTVTAQGLNSTALGYGSTAGGYASFAGNYFTLAQGYYSASFGNNTITMGVGNVAVGAYNDPVLAEPEDFNQTLPNSPLFMVGNGSNPLNRKNALLVQRDGKIGIGDVIPQSTLHLKGLEPTFDAHLRLESYGSTDYMNIVYDGVTKFKNYGAGDEFQFRNAANSIIARIFASGNMTIAGTLAQNSDLRLKTNVVKLNNSLDRLARLNGYHYHWQDPLAGNELQTGFIAQEVEAELPELVSSDEKGIRSVNYIGLIPHLVEAVKELKKENEILRERVRKLEAQDQRGF